MGKFTFSRREWLAAALLLTVLLASLYQIGFRHPLQKELTQIEAQSRQLDEQIEEAVARVARMDGMAASLESLLSDPRITQIAPFDNKEAVLGQLNRILSTAEDYRLTFLEPVTGSEGLVRRSVVMEFTCGDFAAARTIIAKLSGGPWRCLVGNLAMTGAPDVLSGPITVRATITYLESTLLKTSRP